MNNHCNFLILSILDLLPSGPKIEAQLTYKWFNIWRITSNWNSIFVNDELREIPFDETERNTIFKEYYFNSRIYLCFSCHTQVQTDKHSLPNSGQMGQRIIFVQTASKTRGLSQEVVQMLIFQVSMCQPEGNNTFQHFTLKLALQD